MPDRFFVPGHWDSGQEVALPDSEARHISRVLRMAVGEEIEIFNGQRRAALATLVVVNRNSVSVRVHESVALQPVPAQSLTIAVAPPKGDRFRSMIEKLTELGVQRIVPLRTDRSVVDPRDSKLEKLELNMVAACKQCGCNQLPELTAVTNLSDLPKMFPQHRVFYGDQQGELAITLATAPLASDGNPVHTLVIIGPEGGLTELERAHLQQQGAVPVRIGNYTLRIETAAVALAAVFLPAAGGD